MNPAQGPDPRWTVALEGFDPEGEPAREALLALADGRIGVGGATLADRPGRRLWALASGVYEGEGPDTRLLPAPVGLHLPYALLPDAPLRRLLDLRTGVLTEQARCDAGPLRSERFVCLARPGVVALRSACPDDRRGPLLQASTDGGVGEQGREGDVVWMRAAAVEPTTGGVVVAAHETRTQLDGACLVTRLLAYEHDTEASPDPHVAVRRVRAAAAAGFDHLLAEQQAAWAQRWDDADIVVDGDDELQLAIRFALFHLLTSAPEEGEAAVGARGLTGEGYRGHVFWDADTFVLPFLAATRPAAARAMLEYRVRRLPQAEEIARRAGRRGARFPWESARTGVDVTPTSARDWTGRVVPIRTGTLEDHVVAQVAWAADAYLQWTGDEQFASGDGLRLLVQTARFWCSRVRWAPDGKAHVYGVIGPDEYHEPVDDNAFTNVMARWNLRRAADAVEAAPASAPAVAPGEVRSWRETAEALVDGFDPDTGVYEQFAGFRRLEPLVIEEVAPRRPIIADLLLGPERVHGAQVLKQADVLMLHHQVPDEVAPGTLEPNLRFYEPRTAHGSSLSPPVHAALFARARDHGRALDALRMSAFLDRDDLSETTARGLHLATMGGLWQALVLGFAGVRPRAGRLEVDPHLPPGWGRLELTVRYRGSRLRIRCEPSRLEVVADPVAALLVGGAPCSAGPGGIRFRQQGQSWERSA